MHYGATVDPSSRTTRWALACALFIAGGCGGDDGQAPGSGTTGPTTTGSTTTGSIPAPTGSSTGSVADTGSTTAVDGSTTGAADGTSTGAAQCEPIISEILYTVGGDSDDLQWLKLYNPCDAPVDLSDYTLGWGGANYVFDPRLPLALADMIPPQGCYTLGGPLSNASNGDPQLQLAEDLGPDLRDGVAQAAGVALFHLGKAEVDVDSVPIDAVVYGADNIANLIDASGQPVQNPVLGHEAGASLQRMSLTPGDWMPAVPAQPNDCPTLR